MNIRDLLQDPDRGLEVVQMELQKANDGGDENLIKSLEFFRTTLLAQRELMGLQTDIRGRLVTLQKLINQLPPAAAVAIYTDLKTLLNVPNLPGGKDAQLRN